MKRINLAYHRFMVGFRQSSLQRILDESPTNGDMLINASALETACERLIPHIQRVISLTPEESQEHKDLVKLSSDLTTTYEKVQRYGEAKRLLVKAYEKAQLYGIGKSLEPLTSQFPLHLIK